VAILNRFESPSACQLGRKRVAYQLGRKRGLQRVERNLNATREKSANDID
jgi:hypothetical protein